MHRCAPVLAPVCTIFLFNAPVSWCGAERCWCKYTGAHHISLLYTGVLVWCKNFLVQAHRCMVDFLCCTGACTGAFKNFSFAPVCCTGVVRDFGAHHIPELNNTYSISNTKYKMSLLDHF